MVQYNFQDNFRQPILEGRKTSTIRPGAPRAKRGDKLQLYTGLRTKACSLIMETTCVGCKPITLLLGQDAGFIFGGAFFGLNGDLDALTRSEGFESWEELRAWFRDRYKVDEFTGHRTNWNRPR